MNNLKVKKKRKSKTQVQTKEQSAVIHNPAKGCGNGWKKLAQYAQGTKKGIKINSLDSANIKYVRRPRHR